MEIDKNLFKKQVLENQTAQQQAKYWNRNPDQIYRLRKKWNIKKPLFTPNAAINKTLFILQTYNQMSIEDQSEYWKITPKATKQHRNYFKCGKALINELNSIKNDPETYLNKKNQQNSQK